MTTLLPLLALVALLCRARTRAAILLLLVLLASEGAARLLDAGLALPSGSGAGAEAGAIIVLPGDLPSLFDPGRTLPAVDTLASLRTAAELARRTGLPILVAGATTWRALPGAGPALAESLRTDFGTAVRWKEPGGDNLWQAAAASAATLRADGIGHAYLVAEPDRMRLAARLFRRAGVEIAPFPVPHPPRLPLERSALAFGASAWVSSAEALSQWAALACDALDPCARRMLATVTRDPS